MRRVCPHRRGHYLGYRWRNFRKERLSPGDRGAIFGPYLNVIRMHLLIFVFAGLRGLHLAHLAIYPVLAAYFFPWGVLQNRKTPKARTQLSSLVPRRNRFQTVQLEEGMRSDYNPR
jgi:hypothetical protein